MAREPEAKPAREEEPSDEAPAPLPEPMGTVRRELVSPSGRKVQVDVPVYPPFRLESRSEAPPRRVAKRGRPPGSGRNGSGGAS